MNETTNPTTRREFLKTTGKIAAVSAFAGMTVPYVHAAGNETLQIALIGCGGRGTGAAANAMNVKNGPVKLVAMADVFQHRLDTSYDALNHQHADMMDVPKERQFIGFDAYKHAMDCLRPGDIAIFTTPLAFRWVHFTYAVAKGLNVFMEKPLLADGPSARKMLKLAEEASAKNLKVGVGLMSRHSRSLQELQQRIQDGQIGEVILMRGYRMAGPLAACFTEKWPGSPSELLWQISVFHSFIWASGGLFSDFYIHHIDHLCWMKNAWPIKAQALGGRHYRNTPEGIPLVDQNFDSYSVEYTFDDGTKMYMDGRCVAGCNDIYSSYAHGSKGLAIVAHDGDCGMPSSIHSSQMPDRSNTLWQSKVKPDERNPYDNEWNDLVDAIRADKPYNEVPRGVQASVVTSMGRMAAHTGQEITYDQMLNHEDVYAPGIENFTMDSPAPVRADADGKYPVPMPGIIIHHEYDVDKARG
ncbi:MAG TPA: Gfo/Idh/MocA family oxidoreductase [Verrucomicrobiae bacterium]|jgi:predicted dehydrogenase|nr:Gfo/Idh/MocA family oxidoreductase [Verrucomicrobiae bacterium]